MPQNNTARSGRIKSGTVRPAAAATWAFVGRRRLDAGLLTTFSVEVSRIVRTVALRHGFAVKASGLTFDGRELLRSVDVLGASVYVALTARVDLHSGAFTSKEAQGAGHSGMTSNSLHPLSCR